MLCEIPEIFLDWAEGAFPVNKCSIRSVFVEDGYRAVSGVVFIRRMRWLYILLKGADGSHWESIG